LKKGKDRFSSEFKIMAVFRTSIGWYLSSPRVFPGRALTRIL
jgi:hypothetical protein